MKRLFNLKRLLFALLVGCAVSFLPYITSNFPESGILGSVQLETEYFSLPGTLIDLITAGHVTEVSIWVINAVDIGFYVGLTYYLLTLKARYTQRMSLMSSNEKVTVKRADIAA
jgi:hypothetical protein